MNEFVLGQESKQGSCCKSLSLKKKGLSRRTMDIEKKHVSNGDSKFAKAIGLNWE